MKNVVLAVCLLVVVGGACADEWVNGYTKRDGTYVEGHMKSSPNQYRYDNYSSQGNSNPYTGTTGTQRNEYSTPPAYNKSYGSTYGYGGGQSRKK